MALITDPDLLNQATEVTYDTTAKTIALSEAGNLSSDGVTLKALYSFTKEEWINDAAKPQYDFPFTPITDESFELIDGWNFLDAASKYLIRTAGWTVVDVVTGNPTEIWSGIIGLGNIEADDQLYFNQGAGATNFQLTGQVNQAVQVYSDPNADGSTADGYDYRTVFTMYVREQGQIFGQASIADIGVTTMTNIAYRFPISTATDLKITATDTDITTNAPYTGMSITYHQVTQQYNIGGINYDFGITIDGNGGSAEQIYEFVQWSLRQATDIDDEADAPTQTGNLQDELLRFVGDNIETLSATNDDGGGSGIYISNFDAADTNRISFEDNTGSTRTFPFVATLTLNFNTNLQNDTAAIFRVFFTNDDAGDDAGNDYDTGGAILVNSNTSFTTVDRERVSNVATLTTDSNHGLEVGDIVVISGLGDASYDTALSVVTAVGSSTTFSYDSTGGDESNTADTSGTVQQAVGGKVDGVTSLSFTYDYDNNTQRGVSSAGTDAPVTVVAIGEGTAQYVRATGTIARSNSNSVSLVSPLERNYENPV